MALTGMHFCKPTVVGLDTKKQNSRPIFQSMRLLSSASNTMHPTKHHDFPFVPLTGHKLVDDPCIPTSFDIMEDDHSNFDGDFSFVKSSNFTNARALFKNASFKGCHQFPMISISQLVGGFVGSKSQVRANNRESHQIWDVVFRKLDEFVHSRPVERYSEHCYEFQTLSRNIIGSLYKEGGSALGLATSYILADGGQSFKNTKPTSNITKSSPTTQKPVEIIPPPADTFVSRSSIPASHPPSNPSTVTPVILNVVERLISQSDLSNRDVVAPDPIKFACVDHTVAKTSPTLEPSAVYNSLAGEPSDKDPVPDKTPLVPTEAKQSYAEVAKMPHVGSTADGDHRHPRSKGSPKHRKAGGRHFARGSHDSRQRCVDPSVANWRERAGSAERKDLRRDHFTPAARRTVHHPWKGERKFEPVPKEVARGHRRRENEASKYTKRCPKTVPEFTAGSPRETANGTEPNSCQFYNPDKRSCANWRCRLHCRKSGAKRNAGCFNILVDNGDDVDEQTANTSQSPNENSDIRINTFESYFTTPASCRPLRSDGFLTDQSLPSAPKVLARPRSLSETECSVKPTQTAKERSSSESGESVASEESKANSLSSLTVSSTDSCNLRRRFSSECDSEDSFVIFEGETSDDDSVSSGDWESDGDEGDETDGDFAMVSLAFCTPGQAHDDLGRARLREINARWDVPSCIPGPAPEGNGSTPSKKVVRFADRPATVHRMVTWAHAYRAARCGPWEEMARDRERFGQRVGRSEPVLAAVLTATHREAVLARIVDRGRHDQPSR